MLKTFLQHIAGVLCKRTARKKQLILKKNMRILKIANNGQQAKATDFANASLWVKN